MTDGELITFVKSLKASLTYCAPEAIDELLFDKLRPHVVGPTKRIKELEGRNKQQELSIIALAKWHKDRDEALKAAHQCITDFLDVYGRGCSVLVLDQAAKSLKNDALKLVNRCLAKPELEAAQADGRTYSEGCKP
jgi:hypothetical protein